MNSNDMQQNGTSLVPAWKTQGNNCHMQQSNNDLNTQAYQQTATMTQHTISPNGGSQGLFQQQPMHITHPHLLNLNTNHQYDLQGHQYQMQHVPSPLDTHKYQHLLNQSPQSPKQKHTIKKSTGRPVGRPPKHAKDDSGQ